MDEKFISKLSPTVDFWAGIYLVVIGEYAADLFPRVMSVDELLNKFNKDSFQLKRHLLLHVRLAVKANPVDYDEAVFYCLFTVFFSQRDSSAVQVFSAGGPWQPSA